jgi:hypothetical protein
MATYHQITEYVQQVFGFRIHHACWIADVKARHGLTTKQAHNRQSARFHALPQKWLQSKPHYGISA